MEEKLAEKLVETYRQMRHDYMNQLQVILGYLQMGNMEKAKEYTLKAAKAVRRYDGLPRIKLPLMQSVIAYRLVHYRGEQNPIELKIEEDFEAWKSSDPTLARLVDEILQPIGEDTKGEIKACRISFKGEPSARIEITLEGEPQKMQYLHNLSTVDIGLSIEITTPVVGTMCLVIREKHDEQEDKREA